ncbi:hypothetical protein GCM10023079_30850 [Streptomyces chitinivorans]
MIRSIVEFILGWFWPATGARRAETAEAPRCALCGVPGSFGPIKADDPASGVCPQCFRDSQFQRRLVVTARALPLEVFDGDRTPLVRPYVAAMGQEVQR